MPNDSVVSSVWPIIMDDQQRVHPRILLFISVKRPSSNSGITMLLHVVCLHYITLQHHSAWLVSDEVLFWREKEDLFEEFIAFVLCQIRKCIIYVWCGEVTRYMRPFCSLTAAEIDPIRYAFGRRQMQSKLWKNAVAFRTIDILPFIHSITHSF